MPSYAVIQWVKLVSKHLPTGKTRHYRGGELLPTPRELKIGKYPNDHGFYLLYFDGAGNEMTDTYHDTLEDAMAQAEREFQVKVDDWEKG